MVFWQRLGNFTYSFLSGIVIGLPVYITINDYLFYVARVEGTSMQPTLNPNHRKESDVVFLDRWNASTENIQRGDIVALTSPTDHTISFIKRIIGLEGDFIRTPRYKNDYVYVPRGHCWVEGDNVCSSLDSNSFGPVSLGLVKGRATHIVWPPKRWSKLEHNIPPFRSPTIPKKIKVIYDNVIYEREDTIENQPQHRECKDNLQLTTDR